MTIHPLFIEQSRHSAWADALVFSAIIGRPEAEGDASILKRLRHQHLAQKAFLDFWTGQPIDHRQAQSLDIRALAAFVRDLHAGMMPYVASVREESLDRFVELPSKRVMAERLGFEPGDPTLSETFMHLFSHNAYHRGQVCARLRELGFDPPGTDYIVWIWERKPEPSWAFLS